MENAYLVSVTEEKNSREIWQTQFGLTKTNINTNVMLIVLFCDPPHKSPYPSLIMRKNINSGSFYNIPNQYSSKLSRSSKTKKA
jgi:hypothetical protein